MSYLTSSLVNITLEVMLKNLQFPQYLKIINTLKVQGLLKFPSVFLILTVGA